MIRTNLAVWLCTALLLASALAIGLFAAALLERQLEKTAPVAPKQLARQDAQTNTGARARPSPPSVNPATPQAAANALPFLKAQRTRHEIILMGAAALDARMHLAETAREAAPDAQVLNFMKPAPAAPDDWLAAAQGAIRAIAALQMGEVEVNGAVHIEGVTAGSEARDAAERALRNEIPDGYALDFDVRIITPVAAFVAPESAKSAARAPQVGKAPERNQAEAMTAAELTIADGAASGEADSGASSSDAGPQTPVRLASAPPDDADQARGAPLISPFEFTAEKTPTGATLSGAVPSAAAAAELAEILDADGNALTTSRGAPKDWLDAARTALKGLRALRSGALRAEGTTFSLSGAAGVETGAPDAFAAKLRGSMPAGYAIAITVTSPAPGETAAPDATVGAAAPSPAFQLEIRKTADGDVTLRGLAPGDALSAGISAYAASTFGTMRTHGDITHAPGRVASGWPVAAMSGIQIIALLREGDGTLRSGMLTIAGVAPDTATLTAVRDILARAEFGQIQVRTDIALAKSPVRSPSLSGEACIAALNIQIGGAAITFEPGSATIAAGNAAAVEALAKILAQCGEQAIEVGGYTDSQGSDGFNLRLSKERAAAVRAALIAAGAPAGQLSARGYGEANPIADNNSKAGRAANRRIEFHMKQ